MNTKNPAHVVDESTLAFSFKSDDCARQWAVDFTNGRLSLIEKNYNELISSEELSLTASFWMLVSHWCGTYDLKSKFTPWLDAIVKKLPQIPVSGTPHGKLSVFASDNGSAVVLDQAGQLFKTKVSSEGKIIKQSPVLPISHAEAVRLWQKSMDSEEWVCSDTLSLRFMNVIAGALPYPTE